MDATPFRPVGTRAAATIGSTVTSITTSGTQADAILIQNLDASDDARYTIDGTDPTSAIGFILYHSVAATPNPEPKLIPLGRGVTLKLIRAASSDVSIEYQLVKLRSRP